VRFLSLFVYWLGLPLKCKFGAHVLDPDEHGFGFGRIDYFCGRCQRLIRSVPLEEATPEDVVRIMALQSQVESLERDGKNP
jgi:hypothetical protein